MCIQPKKTHGFVLTDLPGPPESFRPKEITETSVKLAWSEPNNTGGCDITDYHLESKEATRAKWSKVRVTGFAGLVRLLFQGN